MNIAYSTFRKEVEQTVSSYFKFKHFNVNEKYRYSLDKREDWKRNIILAEVAQYIENYHERSALNKKPFPLHKYIHNGLSSQAYLFNLLGDIVRTGDTQLLKQIFTDDYQAITPESNICFEYYDRNIFNENQAQPTSFDFAIINNSAKSIFVEAKFMEQDFGGCSSIGNGICNGSNPLSLNNCYLTKVKKRTYWDKMHKYEVDRYYQNDHICPFVLYYQFYREVLFAKEKNGVFYLLYDERSPVFVNNGIGLFEILYNSLPHELQQITKTITSQYILSILESNGKSWISEFKAKYGIK